MGLETRRMAFLTFSKGPGTTVGDSLSIVNHQPLGKTGLHSLWEPSKRGLIFRGRSSRNDGLKETGGGAPTELT